MGRPEAPLDPSVSPLAKFAYDLRELRRTANEPTYEAMARRTGKGSSTLADAASGRKLPSWPTVVAYVTACGGDPGEWEARWEALRDARSPSLAVQRLVTSPSDARAVRKNDAQETGDGPLTELTSTDRGPKRRRRLLAIVGGMVGLLLIAGAAVWQWYNPNHPAAWKAPAVISDGADPEDSGCASDPAELQLNDAEVDYMGLPAGSAQLKYSPGCGVAWARFQPFPKAEIPTHIAIHVDIVRPDDNNQRSSFEAPYVGAPVYGNVMLSTSRCVYAAVWIGDKPADAVETHTHCFRGRTYVR